jgi:hypothetical protein
MLDIGTIINYRKNKKNKYKGIVISISESGNNDHGIVEVWLYSTTDYGYNNCEHFCYENYKDFLEIIRQPEKNKELYIGKLVKTKYGLGLIIKEDLEDYTVFMYNQLNDFQPYSKYVENYEEDIDIDIEENAMYKDSAFNYSTHSIIFKSIDFLD